MTSTPRRLAVLQSNYVPWKGVFDLIDRADVFVLYDQMQYTKQDWRNRNRIKTAQGMRWLTVPVTVEGLYEQTIRETRVADPRWIDSHVGKVRQAYAHASCFREWFPRIEATYERCRGLEYLSDVNRLWIETICGWLGIDTEIRWDSEFTVGGDRTERLLALADVTGADIYVSGPAARDYMDETPWTATGRSLEWMEYGPYPTYEQVHGDFEHAVTILDVLLHTGDRAREFVRSARSEPVP